MIKKRVIMATATLLLTLGMFTIPAYAHDGVSGGSTSGTETTSTSGSGSNSGSTTTTSTSAHDSQEVTISSTHSEDETKVENESDHQAEQEKSDLMETETETEIKDLLKTHKKHSDEDRKKNCQTAEKGLETKLANLSTNATAFQTKIDKALDLAIAYQKDNSITVVGFDRLVTAAQTAKGTAAASVNILNGLSPNLDCTTSTVASNVAGFKVAAKQAKTDLMAYKDAVKTVLKSLETAKEDQ